MIRLSRSVQAVQGQKFTVDPAWKRRLAEKGIAADRDWSQVVGDELKSTSLATKCYRMTLKDGVVVYFKRYVYPPKFWLEFWMRPGKAAVETWAYAQLQKLDIPTLDVIAFGERRIFGMLIATCIVTREAPDAQDLRFFARDVWYHMPELERKRVYREIASQLVEQVRTAHQGGFFHHDLKWRNIMIQRQGERYVPVWIDSPRASRMRFREHRGMVVDLSNLVRMAVSYLNKYDYMRFLCDYLGKERKPGDATRLYREVARHLSKRPPRPTVLPPR